MAVEQPEGKVAGKPEHDEGGHGLGSNLPAGPGKETGSGTWSNGTAILS